DLFLNLPVRRKFLGSDINESNKISKIILALALGYDKVSFKFIKDNRLVFQTLINEDLENKIYKLLDENLKDNIIEINIKNSLYKVKGYISKSNYYRGNRSMEYIFVNNRLIENENISRAIENEYKSLIPSQRFPGFFIFIETKASNIDVNIHPNKKEIKFTYENELIDLLRESISEKLYENSSIKELKLNDIKKRELNFYDDYSEILNTYNKVNEEENSYDISYKIENKDTENKDIQNKENDFFKGLELNFIDDKIPKNTFTIEETKTNKINISNLSYTCSIFNRYSLFTYNDKILILDHRRADQRIKFDQYMKNFKSDSISSQQLLEQKIVKVSLE
ncbi:MAG: DNA mismatch repair endonuclease MutL, partial [Pseudomonas aeruginosa]|nr:DNA mismatch repair endonuclease MutL [Pseudomonas aeruginosa]